MAKGVSVQTTSRRLRSFEKRRLLRPYTASEVVDLGSRIYRVIARYVLLPTLGPMVLAAAALLYVRSFVFPNLFLGITGGGLDRQFMEVAVLLGTGLLFALPLFLLGLAYAAGPVVRLSSQVMLGEKIDTSVLQADSRRYWGTMVKSIGLGVIKVLWLPLVSIVLLGISALVSTLPGRADAVAGGAVAFAYLGFGLSVLVCPFLLTSASLTAPIALLENVSAQEAVNRSKYLNANRPRVSSTSGVAITLGFTLFVLYFVLSFGMTSLLWIVGATEWVKSLSVLGPWTDLASNLMEVVPFTFTLWILAPLWGSTMTVLYYDRRIKLEGLDIETLAEDVLHADRHQALLN
jgi:hypothetical protein